MPLLTTELESIKKNFANPATRKIELSKLEGYIHLHEQPCRKHGRLVCGSCFFIGKCNKPKCACLGYCKSGGAGSVCKECFHPPDMHRRCPLQLREASLGKAMLDIMNRIREPDLSVPASVSGTPLCEIIVPPPEPHEKVL